MLRKLLLVFVLLSLSTVWSQTPNLKIHLKNGTTNSFSVLDIKKITFNGITKIENAKKYTDLIKKFKLLQNHPNPFNPKTVIRYDLPKPGIVDLTIYDIKGQLVKKISNNCQAGINKTIWDGKNSKGYLVASGIYLYQVIFENSILTKQMILLK